MVMRSPTGLMEEISMSPSSLAALCLTTKEIYEIVKKDPTYIESRKMFEKIRKYPMDLKYASEVQKKNEDLVLTAVKEFYGAFMYANPKLKNDKKFLLRAVKCNVDILESVGAELKKDKEFMAQAIELDSVAWKYVDETLKSDETFRDRVMPGWRHPVRAEEGTPPSPTRKLHPK
jgi:hypothetical protein